MGKPSGRKYTSEEQEVITEFIAIYRRAAEAHVQRLISIFAEFRDENWKGQYTYWRAYVAACKHLASLAGHTVKPGT